MRKILLLMLFIISVGCGGTWELTSSGHYSDYSVPSTQPDYRYGVYGWGYYDQFGRPLYYGQYPTGAIGYRGFGPRILIVSKPKPKVRVKGGRGEKGDYITEKPSGAELFFKYCAVCHMNGIAGAPHPTEMKLDLEVAKNGRGAMPPMGHLGDETLEEIFNYIKKLQ